MMIYLHCCEMGSQRGLPTANPGAKEDVQWGCSQVLNDRFCRGVGGNMTVALVFPCLDYKDVSYRGWNMKSSKSCFHILSLDGFSIV